MKKLGFGLMRLPRIDKNDPTSIDIETVKQMTDEFIAEGFTYFDTAWMYMGHMSERAVKTALIDRHKRDTFTLATKFHAAYAKEKGDVGRIFSEQFEKTGAGFFDYYLLHDLNRENYAKCTEFGAFEFFAEKKAEGKIKHLGFSFHDTPEVLDRVITEHPELEFVQLQINYLDWDSPAIRSRECYETARRHGLPVIVMEPVKGGTLAKLPDEIEEKMKALHPDWSIPSWAIRFCAGLEGVFVVLSGMSTLEQLRDNMSYMKDFKPLNDEENALIAEAVAALNASPFIPCTNCAYCVEGCPVNIPIPKYFSLYNADRKEAEGRPWSTQNEYYENLKIDHGAPDDCVECGQCEGMCPQHIRIRKRLKEVAEYFAKYN